MADYPNYAHVVDREVNEVKADSTESVMRETSLEDDLSTLEQQIAALMNLMQDIQRTRNRINEKMDHNGIRASKNFEALALILRGEYSEPATGKAQW